MGFSDFCNQKPLKISQQKIFAQSCNNIPYTHIAKRKPTLCACMHTRTHTESISSNKHMGVYSICYLLNRNKSKQIQNKLTLQSFRLWPAFDFRVMNDLPLSNCSFLYLCMISDATIHSICCKGINRQAD